MSEPKHIADFYGVKLYADCPEEQATAIVRILARWSVQSDLKVDSILESCGLKAKPVEVSKPDGEFVPEDKPKVAERDESRYPKVVTAEPKKEGERKEEPREHKQEAPKTVPINQPNATKQK